MRLREAGGSTIRTSHLIRTSRVIGTSRVVRTPRLIRTLAVAIGLAALLLVAGAALTPSTGQAAMRGLIDVDCQDQDPAERDRIFREIANRLGAKAIRVWVLWNKAEPQQGQYDEDYLQNLYDTIVQAREYKLRVDVVVFQTPRWASDQRFWNSPPASTIPTGYQPYYAMRTDALDDWERFARELATRFKGRVTWYECWNEPNLWSYLYPQQYGGDKYFSARFYVKMLKAFYKGIKAGYPKALVLGPCTGPWGKNNRTTTSPKRFANRMKYHKAWRWWDGYSHHPYPVGGTPPAPDKPPRFPKYTISLGNIRWLLRKFPNTQFFFTEYGYTTGDTVYFGGGKVSEKTQAKYLAQAYRIADKLPRTRLLMWYQRIDQWTPGEPANRGLYFGLRRYDKTRKPSWYSFRRICR